MPYTSDELENVDFYQQYINKNRVNYLDQVSKGATNLFRRTNGTLMLFEDIETGLGLEEANFDNDYYSQLNNALQGEIATFMEILYDPNALAEYIAQNPGMSAGSMGTNPPPTFSINDVPDFIRSIMTTRYTSQYPAHVKTSTLEKVVDRSISELAIVKFAETLPDGITNGDVITNEFAADNRKWLIESNQKRIFSAIEAFYASGVPFSKVKRLTMEQLNKIPDGEAVE